LAAAMRPIQLGRAVKQRSLSLSESFGAALACDKSLEIERRRLSARFALYESRPRRRKLGFLFFNKPQGGMHDVAGESWRSWAICASIKETKWSPRSRPAVLFILHCPRATIPFFGPALKRQLNAHAYCAMPLPNDQFSFGTSKRFTKMFSGLMPGFLARSSTIRA
jgi:hypothetical protein